MVESAWKKARMSYPIEMIFRAAENELEDFSLRWFEQTYPLGVEDKDPFWGERAASSPSCSEVAYAESGDLRIVQSSRRHSLIVGAWGRVKVEHFKRNASGKWKPFKADHLEVQGNVFIKEVGFDPVEFAISDSKDDAKSVAQSHAHGGLTVVAVPFVEGCGGVGANSVLWACTCSGTPPSLP